jgi:hypothetical protein
MYEHRFLYISQSPAFWSYSPFSHLCGPVWDENHRPSPLSNSFAGRPVVGAMTALDGINGTVCNATQYEQSQALRQNGYSSPPISCLTSGESIGLVVNILSHQSPTPSLFNLQFAAEASALSCICVIFIFIWIGVRLTSIHVSIMFDEMVHSGTYVGIRRRSQTVIGRCFRGLLTSTWSA